MFGGIGMGSGVDVGVGGVARNGKTTTAEGIPEFNRQREVGRSSGRCRAGVSCCDDLEKTVRRYSWLTFSVWSAARHSDSDLASVGGLRLEGARNSDLTGGMHQQPRDVFRGAFLGHGLLLLHRWCSCGLL